MQRAINLRFLADVGWSFVPNGALRLQSFVFTGHRRLDLHQRGLELSLVLMFLASSAFAANRHLLVGDFVLSDVSLG